MRHSIIFLALGALALVLGACNTNTSHEGANPIDYDGLHGQTDTLLDDAAPSDTGGADQGSGDGGSGDMGEAGDLTSAPDTPPQGCGGTGTVCGMDELCNPITGECEAMGQCDGINEACDPSKPEPLPYVCIEYEVGKGICREYCVGPTFEEASEGTYVDPCGADYDCAAASGETSYCVPSGCESFFVNDCGPDASCLPTWINDVNACVPDGWGIFGDLCDVHTDCDHNLLCVDGVCADGECAPFSDLPACAEGQSCISAKVGAQELDMGWCADACDVFLSECEEGSWCTPEVDKPEPGPVNGYCMPDLGDAPEGTECENSPNVCDVGLLCIKSSTEAAVCEQMCDPDAKPPITQGVCPGEQACVPLLVSSDAGQLDAVLDFGSCVDGCTPWTPQSLSGCEGAWCLPIMFNPTDGQCLGDMGSSQKNQPCDDTSLDTTCGPGMLCLDAQPGAVLSGNCRALCRVDSPPGGTGATCTGGETCDELSLIGANAQSFPTGIGWCNPH